MAQFLFLDNTQKLTRAHATCNCTLQASQISQLQDLSAVLGLPLSNMSTACSPIRFVSRLDDTAAGRRRGLHMAEAEAAAAAGAAGHASTNIYDASAGGNAVAGSGGARAILQDFGGACDPKATYQVRRYPAACDTHCSHPWHGCGTDRSASLGARCLTC